MKIQYVALLLGSMVLCAQGRAQTPNAILQKTKTQFFEKYKVAFNQTLYAPNPVGTLDTLKYQIHIVKNTKSITGYDAVVNGAYYDHFFIDNEYKYVNHYKKEVALFSDQKPAYRKEVLETSLAYSRSPMLLLSAYDWKFVKDTLFDDHMHKNYVHVLNDKVVQGNSIYTEQHLFIDEETHLLKRWERRNYFKGSLSQRLVVVYRDYVFNEDEAPLSFNTPSTYLSTLFSQKIPVAPLESGVQAPDFRLKDLDGNPIALASLKGYKVLLKFSSIGCGNSHEALLYMNEEDYHLPADIKPLYLSIWEKETDVREYFSKIKTAMPVLPNAEEVAKTYKVTSTPTFILIDEAGIVEQVILGKDLVFLDSLKVNE